MYFRFARVVFFVALFLAVAGASTSSHAAKSKASAKAAAAPAAESPSLPAAELTLGFQSRQSETEGIGDLLLPLWSPGGKGLLFLNPRTAVTDHSAEEGNLGLGYRHLLPGLDLILGANAFFDYRDVPAGNYSQWGFGLELLSPWVDARANYYDPDDKKLVVASETETTSRQSVRSSSGWSDVYPEGHGFYQDYVVSRTLLTETFSRTFEQYQQPLGGYDFEVGLRLPLPAKPETAEARVFAGYYDFDRDYGPDAKGWKARAELRLASSLFLDAGAYENDELTGSDWFAGARVSVPLDLAALSRGRNPFAPARARLSREPRDFSARLTEMVQRDPQIRLETSKFLENKSLASSSSQSQTSRIRHPVNVLPDVTFVYGDASRPGDGSAERPFSSVQQGVDAAFGLRNVYVHAFSGPYNENVVLSPNTVLLGSGLPIPGLGNQFFGGNSAPVVDGLNLGPSISMANNTRVSGFHVRNTDRGGAPRIVEILGMPEFDVSRVGIYGNNASDLLVADNLISGCSDGALFARQGDFKLVFDHNVSSGNDGNGLAVFAVGGEFSEARRSPAPERPNMELFILESRLSGNGAQGGILQSTGYGSSAISIANCDFSANAHGGLYLAQRFCMDALAELDRVSFVDNLGNGFFLSQSLNDISFANLHSVLSLRNLGIGAAVFQFDSGIAASQLSHVMASGHSFGPGLLFQQMDNNLSTVVLRDFAADDNGFSGVYALQSGSAFAGMAAMDGRIVGNGFADSGSGLELFQMDNGVAFAHMIDLDASGNRNMGLSIAQQFSDVHARIYLTDVSASGNGIDGVDLLQIGNADASFHATNSIASENSRHGFSIAQWDNSRDSLVAFANSSAIANGEDGFRVSQIVADSSGISNASASVSFAVARADFNGGSGFDALQRGFESARISANQSAAIQNDGCGFLFEQRFNEQADVLVADSVARLNGSNGFACSQSQNGVAGASIRSSAANLNGGNGVEIDQNLNEYAAVLVEDSEMDRNDGSGIIVRQSNTAELAFAVVAGKTANRNGQDGIAILQADNRIAAGGAVDVHASQNAGSGIAIRQSSSAVSAMAVLLNCVANANGPGSGAAGIFVRQSDNPESTASVQECTANRNDADGIRIEQSAFSTADAAIVDSIAKFNSGVQTIVVQTP